MSDPKVLRGLRRELTKEIFEDLAALQCEPSEILGYIGTDEGRLDRWCRRVYRRSLLDILPMLRADGLIAIRRASFEQLKKSAALISQQYNRFLSGGGDEEEARSRNALQALTEMVRMPEDAVREVFE